MGGPGLGLGLRLGLRLAARPPGPAPAPRSPGRQTMTHDPDPGPAAGPGDWYELASHGDSDGRGTVSAGPTDPAGSSGGAGFLCQAPGAAPSITIVVA